MAINWTLRFSKTLSELSKLEEVKRFAKKLLKDLTNKEIKIENFEIKTKELKSKIEDLEQEKKALEKRLEKYIKDEINIKSNQPSSKKPEWDKEGNLIKNKKRKKKRKKQKGCGNRKKIIMEINEINNNPLEVCPLCGEDLRKEKVLEKTERIIEDIVSPANKTIIYKEEQERKWCSNCQQLVSSTSEKALPSSDYGLNTVTLMAYLWVVSSLSLPNIQKFLNSFMKIRLSVSGISKLMIRLSQIFQPVYKEILEEVKIGSEIYADETGWRIKGQLHWLWSFANIRSSYYWIDKSRGSPVVEKILGTIFYGIMITDAWHAYTKILCAKQTCMSHFFRKIRLFIEKYPEYRSIMSFYLKLRRIIKDAQKLQLQRNKLKELVFNSVIRHAN
ncbi:MAG: transposase [Desulfobacteraceae bacterium]|nr:transposase [Desulfobacteraceae bacterium]